MVARARVAEEYMGTTEAAMRLNVTDPTVRHWFDAGKLGGILVRTPRGGSRRLLSRSDVERLAREQLLATKWLVEEGK